MPMNIVRNVSDLKDNDNDFKTDKGQLSERKIYKRIKRETAL